MSPLRFAALLAFLCSFEAAVAGAIEVADDAGNSIVLPRAARRIIGLSPHATELLFAVGAGSRVVATVEFSDYPPAARAIPRIGSSSGLDVERIVALRPDLIVGWASGNPKRTLERLRDLGFPVYLTEPRQLAHIARNLERLGRLVGNSAAAHAQAQRFTARYRSLAMRYRRRPTVRVFYQVVDPLLITVNGEHLVSEVLRLCGGENVFAALPVLAPAVGEESVLHADPEAIVAGGTEDGWRAWLAHWRMRTELTAVRRDALYFIPASLLHRQGPRVIDGAERVCAALDDARGKR